jgi:hypothetical protein
MRGAGGPPVPQETGPLRRSNKVALRIPLARIPVRRVPVVGLIVIALLAGLTSLQVSIAPPAEAAPALLTKVSPSAGWQIGFGSWYSADVTQELFSSVAVDDVDGNGAPDVVVGFPDGYVHILSLPDGVLRRSKWTGPGAVQASPAVVDLFGNGRKQILTANTGGNVMAFDAATGDTTFFVTLGGTPQHLPGVFSTPVAADINSDGDMEIVVSSWDHYLHVFQLDGSELPGFPVFLKDTSWSTPAVADLDGDGRQEIVFGYDCDGVEGQDCYPHGKGGYIGVLEPDGRWRPGFPSFVSNQVVWSSPALVDLSGDGVLDIVVGTGNMPPWIMPGARVVHALDSAGNRIPGWPVAVGGETTSSPAVGDLDGDSKPDVAIVAEDGKLYGIRANGSTMFATCIRNNTASSCGGGGALHTSASIGAVYGGSQQYAVVGGEQWMNVIDGAGGIVARGEGFAGTYPFTAAPTLASVGGKTWIVSFAAAPSGSGWAGRIFAWTTNTALGGSAWPTFHQNLRRTGSVSDLVPPTATLGALPNPAASRNVNVSWDGSDPAGGSGLASFDVETNDGGTAWVPWLSATTARAATLWTIPGHSMQVRVRARDRAGNLSPWVTGSFNVAAGAGGAPFTVAYGVGSRGRLAGYDSPPATGPQWGYPIARGVGVRPDGKGYVLDGWGAMHPFAGAPAIQVTGYWPGQDIARGVAMSPDGTWGYVLDWWGALHPVGGAPTITTGPYWYGQDMARAVVLAPGTTKANPSGWVLDAWGGVHAFGSAPRVYSTGYWPGQDVARGLTVNPDGSGYVLDWWGGLHPFGGAARVSTPAYWPGQDVARGVVSIGSAGSPAGYVLDNFGGLNRFGSSPAITATDYGPSFDARGIALLR